MLAIIIALQHPNRNLAMANTVFVLSYCSCQLRVSRANWCRRRAVFRAH